MEKNWVHLKDVEKKLLFGQGLCSYPNGLRRTRSIFWHLQTGLKFCMWVSMPTPTRNPKIDRISIPRARCVTSGQCFRCFDQKNYKKFIKWQKATKLVMHPSHGGTTLLKKFGFIWRMSKKTRFRTGPLLLPKRSTKNEVNFLTSSDWPEILHVS